MEATEPISRRPPNAAWKREGRENRGLDGLMGA
jgi:hypothetical protein